MTKKKAFAVILALCLLTLLGFFGGRSLLKTLYPIKYTQFVEEEAQKNNLDKYFVYAVIKCESGYDTNAESPVGAVGLMQIMPDTFDWITQKVGGTDDFTQATDPKTNISYGCWFYGWLMERYGDEKTAIAAYHAGMGNADKWLEDERYSSDGKTLDKIPFPSTEEYAEKVMKTKHIYYRLYSRKES